MKRSLHVIVTLAILAILATSIAGCGRYAQDAKDTAFEETKASTLLKKYTDFKDLAASLDSKLASLEAFQGKIDRMDEAYDGVPRNQWTRSDADSYNQWQTELDGLKATYNEGAAKYNANMVKANYAFTNVGDLPKGADKPLPREFREYITK